MEVIRKLYGMKAHEATSLKRKEGKEENRYTFEIATIEKLREPHCI